MRKNIGFTLIELVIVIVILGILGAVAAPKLLNLQGDAYAANMKAMHNAVRTATTLANAKAMIKEVDQLGSVKLDMDNNFTISELNVDNPQILDMVFGYPAANGNGIIKLLVNGDKFSFKDKGDYLYTHRGTNYSVLTIAPRARHDSNQQPIEEKRCELTYEQPSQLGREPKVKLYLQGC